MSDPVALEKKIIYAKVFDPYGAEPFLLRLNEFSKQFCICSKNFPNSIAVNLHSCTCCARDLGGFLISSLNMFSNECSPNPPALLTDSKNLDLKFVNLGHTSTRCFKLTESPLQNAHLTLFDRLFVRNKN